jgi:uncharacterized protein
MDTQLYAKIISESLQLQLRQIENTLNLLDDGATIPFISRYRKEATGGLDEVQIGAISQQYDKLIELTKRKETIISTIDEQGKLTDDLRRKIEDCFDANVLEDIYLPYKPKRKTRAEVARQKGLEPLAATLMLQREYNIEAVAKRFVKGDVQSVDDALAGARDIIAEQINEDERSRRVMRQSFSRAAMITSKVVKGKEKDAEAAKFRDYFDFTEPLRRCTSHRLLAMRRGAAEGVLRVSIGLIDDEECIDRIAQKFVRNNKSCSPHVEAALRDAYKRLLKPSIETEFAALSKEKADAEAIRVFAANLRQLLLAAPLGHKRVMGIDPGFRTGCKVVCLDQQGNLAYNCAIYPHPPKNDYAGAAKTITELVRKYKIEAFAIGNGTAGRETEAFIKGLNLGDDVSVFSVSEDGASIYSASKIARDEFPDYDVTVRGAVSIGRRLIDPLAELVKIDPKSIGVGQYQHDVDQTMLKQSLDRTVESCVNLVGVNLNTASSHLLTYVSGLGAAQAKRIVDYRTENGPFTSRRQLLDVPRLGAKAFEQCAGFLRIPNADNPLDNSAVHPERYALVAQMARDLKCSVADLIKNKALRQQIQLDKYVSNSVGLPTLNDIMRELDKPGLDPRDAIQTFSFDPNLRTFDDLRIGMVVPGIVSNVTDFGCFVDIGIKEKGLVHISKLSNTFVKDPSAVVSVHQQVAVKVIDVDDARHRIALSMVLD